MCDTWGLFAFLSLKLCGNAPEKWEADNTDEQGRVVENVVAVDWDNNVGMVVLDI